MRVTNRDRVKTMSSEASAATADIIQSYYVTNRVFRVSARAIR